MSDFYPWGLYDYRPKKLPPSAALDNADIQHYKTAAEPIQQETWRAPDRYYRILMFLPVLKNAEPSILRLRGWV